MTDSRDDLNDTKQTDSKRKSAPWTAEDFDAERAGRLVENLRAEIDQLKAAKKALEEERQAREDSEKSEAQKAADRAAKAEERAAEAEKALYIERAMRKHAIPEDLVEFITGKDEEEINTRAERLASRLGKGGEKDDGEEGSGEPDDGGNDGRPRPALRPGHGGETPEPFDPDAIALASRDY